MRTLKAQPSEQQLQKLIRETVAGLQSSRITSGDGSIVIMAEEKYESLILTLEFLMTTGLFENVLEGQFNQLKKEELPDLFSHIKFKKPSQKFQSLCAICA